MPNSKFHDQISSSEPCDTDNSVEFLPFLQVFVPKQTICLLGMLPPVDSLQKDAEKYEKVDKRREYLPSSLVSLP